MVQNTLKLCQKMSKNEGKSSPNVIIWASGGPQCALVGSGYPKSRLVAPFGVPLGGLGRPIDSIGLLLRRFWEPFCLKIGTLGVSWVHLGTLGIDWRSLSFFLCFWVLQEDPESHSYASLAIF